MSEPTLSVVVPVFDEEAVIDAAFERLRAVLVAMGEPFEILFVDDGSRDSTPAHLERLRAADARVGVVTLSRNFGHQMAISAGMEMARGRAIVVIDADLQDPPEVIPRLVERWRAGADVVYARRIERRGESAFKRGSAAAFYRLLGRLAEVPIPAEAGDFRLVDRRVRDVLVRMPERRRFVRGMVAWTGFRQEAVDYVRDARAAGRSKYSLARMLRLAADALLSFSDRPARWVAGAGAVLFALSCAALVVLAVTAAAPWWWVLAAVAALDGVVLLSLGVVGAYAARIYDEVRGRPPYVVAQSHPPAQAAEGEP
ncbi:MAG: glycosyltransferase family 2 protein [Firmicutes bacterium]|nr:glycosyltransferase family 2 protein [Bacillota bacterium]